MAMVGSFGSGCTYLATRVLKPLGFEVVSLSDILREEFKKQKPCTDPTRSDLQAFGTEIRRVNGAGFLAQRAVEIIKASGSDRYVIDSIRNPAEIRELKRRFANLLVVGVFATEETRWRRVREKYDGNRGAFEKDDQVDREEGVEHGQRVTACFLHADVVIENEKEVHNLSSSQAELLKKQITRCLELLANPGCMPPTEEEALMSIAYANSHRSSCRKRRVGAIVVDDAGHILSSGYNEVPGTNVDETCASQYGMCYRDYIKRKFSSQLKELGISEEKSRFIQEKMWTEFKMLDRCRALHAEEQAILNLAVSGARLTEGARMFVTTYPCNLCANKIVRMGIRQVVYFEPYPVRESVEILNSGRVSQQAFAGVTFNGYFRLFGGMPNGAVP